jgi:pyridoxamine 5'-phosphate oxidase
LRHYLGAQWPGRKAGPERTPARFRRTGRSNTLFQKRILIQKVCNFLGIRVLAIRGLRDGDIDLAPSRSGVGRTQGSRRNGAGRLIVNKARHRHREGAAAKARCEGEHRYAASREGIFPPFVIRSDHRSEHCEVARSILQLNSSSSVNFTEVGDPFALFAEWFLEARQTEINDPEAMSLATVDPDGLPDVRMVLCKQLDARGLIFYTNAESVKGRELAACPRAAALFHWKSLRRQARFRGDVTEVSAAEADAYYRSRPRQSQIGAWASQQSRPLESRARLEALVESFEKKYGAGEIPRPDYWRGFRLAPVEIEFWKDGAFRLHDRVHFAREGDLWRKQRLFP